MPWAINWMFVNTESPSEASLDNSTRMLSSCPNTPELTWNFRNDFFLYVAIAVSATASPLITLSNILVILAVKKFRELQRNSNILIASLAVVDLLVGAVSMPLKIALIALIIRGTASENIVCRLSDITGSFMYTVYNVSFYHLVLIAWERYTAIVKCTDYKILVTKERLQRYAGIAWIASVVTNALHPALSAAGVGDEVLLTLHVTSVLVWFIGMSLMAYFYRMVYIVIRNRKESQIRRVNSLIKARIETKIAFTAVVTMVTVFTSAVPLMCFLILATFVPFFRANSVHHWGEIFLQFNSLANPLLYFYRNKHYRKAVLKLLRFGIPKEVEPVTCSRFKFHEAERHRAVVALLSFRSLVDIESVSCHSHRRAQSCAARTSRGNSRNAQQPGAQQPFKAQLDKAPGEEPAERETAKSFKDSDNDKKPHLHKVGRSNSLMDKGAFVETSACLSVTAVKRRNSAPSGLAAIESRSRTETYNGTNF